MKAVRAPLRSRMALVATVEPCEMREFEATLIAVRQQGAERICVIRLQPFQIERTGDTQGQGQTGGSGIGLFIIAIDGGT